MLCCFFLYRGFIICSQNWHFLAALASAVLIRGQALFSMGDYCNKSGGIWLGDTEALRRAIGFELLKSMASGGHCSWNPV